MLLPLSSSEDNDVCITFSVMCYQDINTTTASFTAVECTVQVDTGYGSVRICVQVEMMSHLNETSSSACFTASVKNVQSNNE